MERLARRTKERSLTLCHRWAAGDEGALEKTGRSGSECPDSFGRRPILMLLLLGAALLPSSCKREERGFRVSPPSAEAARGIQVGELRVAHYWPKPPVKNGYEENAYAISEGQHLYEAFNCVGCHAHGGGDKGPALMDDKWIYGSNPEQIHATIVEGRPNGMPAFRGKVPDYQVWQIVAYVRSLSGLVNKQAAPNRSDEMKNSPPPNSVKKEQPRNSSPAPSDEMPQ